MKNIRLFNDLSSYNKAYNSDEYIESWTSYINGANNISYNDPTVCVYAYLENKERKEYKGLTSIANSELSGKYPMIELKIGNSVTDIGDHVFHSNLELSSVTISNRVKTIGVGAFAECKKLSSIVIPNSVISLGKIDENENNNEGLNDVGAFYACITLSSLTIGNSVELIDNYAFCNDYTLEHLVIPNSVKKLDFKFLGI